MSRPNPMDILDEIEFLAGQGCDLPYIARALALKEGSIRTFLRRQNRPDLLAQLQRDAA